MVTLKSLLKKSKSILKEDLKSDATKFAKTKYPAGDGYWDTYGTWQKEKRGALSEMAQAFIAGAMWAQAELSKKKKKDDYDGYERDRGHVGYPGDKNKY
jgi:hypothetical protein